MKFGPFDYPLRPEAAVWLLHLLATTATAGYFTGGDEAVAETIGELTTAFGANETNRCLNIPSLV